MEANAPGALLSADTFFVGNLKGAGKIYLHAVVDTYGSYGFGFLHISKQPEAAVAVLHKDVLPFYRNLDLPVKAVLIDNVLCRRGHGKWEREISSRRSIPARCAA